jgi:hypothetical protein
LREDGIERLGNQTGRVVARHNDANFGRGVVHG